VLSNEHGPVARALSAKGTDRFSEISWDCTDSGAVFVHGASLWLECAPYRTVLAGDHEIVVLKVVSLAVNPDAAPLVFHRSNFHNLAPTG
jgi:flavin reductase (DIM6/NTAB) family NADH-FMN oxidoreductase RutF